MTMTKDHSPQVIFRDRFLNWIMGSIGVAVFSVIGLVWNLTIDVKVMQHDRQGDSKMIDTAVAMSKRTLEVSTKNNNILISKADDSTNRMQHKIILNKVDSIQADVWRLTKYNQTYGGELNQNPSSLTINRN